MFQFDPDIYGPTCAKLLRRDATCPVGPGTPDAAAREELESLNAATLLLPRRTVQIEMARCCLAGLWLLHDFLDQSHRISQQVSSPTGSYWHGIMHRREPDYANSKYWFRRVGDHPIHDRLCTEARTAAQQAPPSPNSLFLARQSRWTPLQFVDFCAAVAGSGSEGESLCRQIAHLEWQLLFDFCFRQATQPV